MLITNDKKYERCVLKINQKYREWWWWQKYKFC